MEKQINVNSDRKFNLYIKKLSIFFVVSGLLIPFIPSIFRGDIIRGAVLLAFVINFYKSSTKYDVIGKYIFMLMSLVFISMLYGYFSYNIFKVLGIKILISYTFYFIGYNCIKTKDHLYKMNILFLNIVIIYFSSIIIVNLTGADFKGSYAGLDVSLGVQGPNTLKDLIVLGFIISNLFFYRLPKKMNRFIGLSLTSILVLLLMGQKRGAILGLLLGIIIYLLNTKYKAKLIKASIYSVLFVIILSPFYIEDVIKTYEFRKDRFYLDEDTRDDLLESEARWLEGERWLNDLQYRNIFEIIFGIGYHHTQEYYKTGRMIHTDYILFADTLGLLGFYLYLYIYYLIFTRIRKLTHLLPKTEILHSIKISNYSLIGVSMGLAFSGYSHDMGINSLWLLFVGGSIGFLENEVKRHKGLVVNNEN